MHVDRVEDLPPEPFRAVIINVGTELVSTLALASALAHSSMPVLLVNCEPTPESSAHFDELMARWDFDVLEAPRRSHGETLDRLFRGIMADCVLLLDSDLELRDPALVERMREHLHKPHVFGGGFVNGPGWLHEPPGCDPKTGMFNERAWMPCVVFRTSDVREALAAGVSFKPRTIHNDFMFSKRISRLLATRFQNDFAPESRIVRRLPEEARIRIRDHTLPWLRWARRDFYGLRPNYVYCDTGTDVYQWCRYQKGKVFAGTPLALLGDEARHYAGVTRMKLVPRQRGTQLADIESEVRCRLRDIYGLKVIGI